MTRTGLRRTIFFSLAVAAAAIAALCLGRLAAAGDGLEVERRDVDGIPATLFRANGGAAKATVIVCHGFAGSQQMMQPIATTLAHDHYRVVTFDFAGHGRNMHPLQGGLADLGASTASLIDEIDRVVRFAREEPGFNGRLALVGHSMASELVVQYAMQNRAVDAVVALSLFGRKVTPASPRNLLVVDGALEPGVLRDAAVRIVSEAAGEPAVEGRTYGDPAAGTARRYVFAAGAEHIGVIYSRDALVATRAWLDQVFGAETEGPLDRRGVTFAVLLIALVVLARAALQALPRLRPAPRAPVSAGRLWTISLASAVATPLLLWKAPTNFLPILLGDYLAVHFALYGALLWLGLRLSRREPEAPRVRVNVAAGLALAALVGVALVAALGVPIDAYVASFWPTGERWALVPVLFVAVASTFTAEERMARGEGAPLFAYAILKLGFVVSLSLAIAANPQRLFFLIIVVPVVVALFVLLGLVNRWTYRRSGEPLVGALGSAFTLAWAISVTFPLVG